MKNDMPQELQSIQDVVRYIRACLAERGTKSDEAVASTIVGLETNENIEKWCEEDADLNAIVSVSSDLEWSNGEPRLLAVEWANIETRLNRLEERYLSRP